MYSFAMIGYNWYNVNIIKTVYFQEGKYYAAR